jgi:hypothetical protein
MCTTLPLDPDGEPFDRHPSLTLHAEYHVVSVRAVPGRYVDLQILKEDGSSLALCDSNAHVWNAAVQNGKVNFVDFQGIGPNGPDSFKPWDDFPIRKDGISVVLQDAFEIAQRFLDETIRPDHDVEIVIGHCKEREMNGASATTVEP